MKAQLQLRQAISPLVETTMMARRFLINEADYGRASEQPFITRRCLHWIHNKSALNLLTQRIESVAYAEFMKFVNEFQ